MKLTANTVNSFVFAALVAGGLAFGPVSVSHAAESKPTVSKAVAKPLKAAQDAMQAKKYDEALAKLKEVQAINNRSPYDTHLMNEMLGFVAVRTNNYAEAARALEAGLSSGFLDESEVPGRVRALAQVNYQIKNYDKAIEFGNRAVKGGYADDDMYTLIGQAYYVKGDFKGTKNFMEQYVTSQIKKGQTPKEQSIQLVMSSCLKIDDKDCVTDSLERLVSYYPKTEYWQNLLYSFFQAGDNSERNLLHIYRLMAEVDVLKRPEDYTEMAQLAIEQGSPGEAQRVLEKGFAKNVFTDARDKDKNQRLLDSAKKQAAADLATLAKTEKEAASAAAGDRDVGLGLAYLSYDQFDKAAAALQRGLSKGNVKNEGEARLLLGIALLKTGNKEEAMKSFRAVKGDPKVERIANLWSLHARQA